MSNKKKATKEEIKEFAKELFLVPGRNGKHKHSLQAIVDEILRAFNKKLTRPTILNWSKECDEQGNSWGGIYRASVAAGITGSDISKDKEQDKTAEETFDERVVRETREEYRTSQQMLKYSQIILQGSLAALVGEYKKLLDHHKKATDIPIKEFKAIIDGFDVDRCSKIEAVMNDRIKNIREMGTDDDDKNIKIEIEVVRS